MESEVAAIVTAACIFGGGALYLIVDVLAKNWRKARIVEQQSVLKRAMIEKGFSAEEIVRVIHAGTDPDAKMSKA